MSRGERIVASAPERPLMIFDGDCGFCRRWIARWKSATGDRVAYAPYQEAASRFPEIAESEFRDAVHLIEPDGRVSRGAEAVVRALSTVPGRRWPRALYEKLPGAGAVFETVYRLVARHRQAASAGTAIFFRPTASPPSDLRAIRLFLRLLGVAYAAAFLSLWIQIDGLLGPRGILPVAPFLDWVRQQVGSERFWLAPTLCWLDPSSGGLLHLLCGAGTAAGLLLAAGLDSAPLLFLAWAFYLSLVTVGRVFLGYQWDNLLLEAGFLAIFLAPLPPRFKITSAAPPSRAAIWLERWLLFRLMFSSGVVKLASGDPAWRHLTALRYHYETQPLPTPAAWYFFQLPHAADTVSAVFVFFVELVVPFTIFAPRRIRQAGAAVMILFQLLIALTGNYAFFNLLTIALCVLLFDDASLPAWPRRRRLAPPASALPRRFRLWPSAVAAPAAVVVVLLSFFELGQTLTFQRGWPKALIALDRAAAPFRTVNSYGLFAVMTTTRPEIIVEGSGDGEQWKTYEFRWKPGSLSRAPAFVAPHQPRLDWQMWFAALGDYRGNPWFLSFLQRLLEGSPDVLALLKGNPFPAAPPRYVRAVVYDYHFTSFSERRRTGHWWRRDLLGLYCPVLTLSDGELAPAASAPAPGRPPQIRAEARLSTLSRSRDE